MDTPAISVPNQEPAAFPFPLRPGDPTPADRQLAASFAAKEQARREQKELPELTFAIYGEALQAAGDAVGAADYKAVDSIKHVLDPHKAPLVTSMMRKEDGSAYHPMGEKRCETVADAEELLKKELVGLRKMVEAQQKSGEPNRYDTARIAAYEAFIEGLHRAVGKASVPPLP